MLQQPIIAVRRLYGCGPAARMALPFSRITVTVQEPIVVERWNLDEAGARIVRTLSASR